MKKERFSSLVEVAHLFIYIRVVAASTSGPVKSRCFGKSDEVNYSYRISRDSRFSNSVSPRLSFSRIFTSSIWSSTAKV
jgi:hypothetical protein